MRWSHAVYTVVLCICNDNAVLSDASEHTVPHNFDAVAAIVGNEWDRF
jgi:hypothetical protein